MLAFFMPICIQKAYKKICLVDFEDQRILKLTKSIKGVGLLQTNRTLEIICLFVCFINRYRYHNVPPSPTFYLFDVEIFEKS